MTIKGASYELSKLDYQFKRSISFPIDFPL
jgi:hypothetical protein